MKNIFIFYFLNRFIFFYAIFISILKSNNISPLGISAIIIIHEAVKIFTDAYTGALADKYGVRKIIIFGLIVKAIGLLGWIFCNSFLEFAIFTVLIGLGRSCVLGKIDVYVYNTLVKLGAVDNFKQTLLLLSITESISLTLSGFCAGILGKYGGFNILLITSAFIMLCVHVPFVFVVMKDIDSGNKKYSKEPLSKIIKNAINIIKQNKSILYLIISAAIPFALMMLLSDLYKMIATDIGLNIKQIGNIYSIAHILPMICSIYFLLFLPKLKWINSGHAIILMAIGIILCGISGLFYGKISIFILIIFLGIIPVCNTVLKNALEVNIPNDFRYTITSFTTLVSSLIIVIGFILIGVIATHFSYKTALFCFSGLFLFGILIINKNKNLTNHIAF